MEKRQLSNRMGSAGVAIRRDMDTTTPSLAAGCEPASEPHSVFGSCGRDHMWACKAKYTSKPHVGGIVWSRVN